ncbi:MAG TPA: low-complexity protein [Woeseiaceae bacterium]|nr:low-complexity protein [Woeseiaceae bacterium]
MQERKRARPVALAVGAALASSFAAVGVASADTGASPFAVTTLSAGYMLGAAEGTCGGDKGEKSAEGSCGGDKGAKGAEGSCGGDKGAKDAEGSGGDDKGAKGAEGSGGDEQEKDAEGKCGEGKCGSSI